MCILDDACLATTRTGQCAVWQVVGTKVLGLYCLCNETRYTQQSHESLPSLPVAFDTLLVVSLVVSWPASIRDYQRDDPRPF